MYTGKFHYGTLVLYILLGMVACLCMRKAICFQNGTIVDRKKEIRRQRYFYGLFIVIFTLVATFRMVGPNIGGADALNYKNFFLYALDSNSTYRNLISEPLFLVYCQIIRFFTDEYKIFFAITYTIISGSYCLFIKKYCPRNVSCIPFVLLFFLYLKSWCTMRSSLAVAVFLIGLVLIEEHKIWSSVLLCSTFFIHRMSIVFSIIIVFYYLYKTHISKLQGWKLIAFLVVYITASISVAKVLQSIVLKYAFLEGKDAYYIRQSLNMSLLSRWPMFFAQFLLLLAIIICGKRIPKTQNIEIVRIFCVFDFLMAPACIILGFWRANEFLYVPRLIMWGVIIAECEKKFTKRSRIYYRVLVFVLFLAWLIFRIYQEWEELKIMPYILQI